ncbi:MAG: hypothetical protein II221_04055, partial [Paludibacteraceae bacterium]|nr:hypothetical protein [Paludibacteraceae bacterium]
DSSNTYTEVGMNKNKQGESIKEKALPEEFHSDDFGILSETYRAFSICLFIKSASGESIKNNS